MLLFLLMACPNHDDPIVVELSPDIDVSPEELVFGDRGVPTRTDLKVLISNEGRADLSAALEITGEGAGAYALSDREIELPPPSGGERSEIEVTVTFAPTTYLDYPADLVITSNDTNAPELHVPIAGAGVSAPLPDIYLDAATLDFGDVDAHTERILWLGNGGTADLHVGTLTLEGSGAFSLIADPSLQTLAPGARFPILVGYDPDGQGQNGVVVVPSDDPDEPELRATLLGNGGGDFEYPEAVITCPSQVDPPRLVSLDGFGSSDPGGYEPLAYAWSLARVPTNGAGQPISSAFLSSLAGPTTVLAVDAVGTYEVQLRVTNTQDTVSAPASCVIQAIPDEELVVELTWDTPNADVDLHLALFRADQAADDLEEQALATRPRTAQPDGLAGRDIQIDAV